MPTSPIHALASLGVALAYALIGETARNRKAYEEVLAWWKDADYGVPVIQQARAEYAHLK